MVEQQQQEQPQPQPQPQPRTERRRAGNNNMGDGMVRRRSSSSQIIQMALEAIKDISDDLSSSSSSMASSDVDDGEMPSLTAFNYEASYSSSYTDMSHDFAASTSSMPSLTDHYSFNSRYEEEDDEEEDDEDDEEDNDSSMPVLSDFNDASIANLVDANLAELTLAEDTDDAGDERKSNNTPPVLPIPTRDTAPHRISRQMSIS
jgi:hypothetical protein